MALHSHQYPVGVNIAESSVPWPFLVQLNETLAADSTTDRFLSALMGQLQNVPDLVAGWIGRSGEDGVIKPLASFGGAGPARSGGETIPDAPCVAALRRNQPFYIDDWRNDPAAAPVRAGAPHPTWRSALALPLPGGPPTILVTVSHHLGFFSAHWPPDFAAHVAAVIGAALESRRARAALHHAQTLYESLFKGANLLLTARSQANLLDKLCRLLVESGLFVSATIGQLDGDRVWRHRSAAARHSVSVLRRAITRQSAGEQQKPLNLLAWHACKTLIANNYATDPRFAALQTIARKVGIEAVVSLIITRNRRRFAVLSVTANQPGFFTTEIIALLERLAAMVSHTLDEFDLKAALRAEREAQSEIARRDALTGLPNSLAFQERLTSVLAQAARQQGITVVVKIDLDDFKQVNDRWGPAAGDEVLRTLATRIRAMLPEGDFIARVGGDEFAFILEDWRWTRDIEGFCYQLHETIGARLELPGGDSVHLSHAAGITIYPQDHADADLLMRHARMALFAAKTAKGSDAPFWRLYRDISEEPTQPAFGRVLLQQSALRVFYQPVLDLFSGKIVAVESLARMEDGGKLISPAQFLPDLLLDDRTELFHQMLTAALKQLRLWEQDGQTLTVSVNLDAQILLGDGTLPYMRAALAKAGIPASRLALEILETHDFRDLRRARQQVEAVRATGIRMALDDLGAGYSSVLKIRDLPFDIIKLDRAFVAGLRQQPDDLMFVAVFQSLCAARGIALVVEGVETPDVMDALQMMGVRFAQGYFISHPMPGPDLKGWLAGRVPARPPRKPQTMLGAYAVHLNWLRLFNASQSPAALQAYLRESDHLALDGFIRDRNLGHTKLGRAYASLQALLQAEPVDRGMIAEAAAHLRARLMAAMRGRG